MWTQRLKVLVPAQESEYEKKRFDEETASGIRIEFRRPRQDAGVVESVDTPDLKSVGQMPVGVQVPPPAPIYLYKSVSYVEIYSSYTVFMENPIRNIEDLMPLVLGVTTARETL